MKRVEDYMITGRLDCMNSGLAVPDKQAGPESLLNANGDQITSLFCHRRLAFNITQPEYQNKEGGGGNQALRFSRYNSRSPRTHHRIVFRLAAADTPRHRGSG